jgi:hypothetical protein
MLHFSHLRVLALATSAWLATGCGHKAEAPQPQQVAPLNTHTVAVRYQAQLLAGATVGLPQNLNLVVAYERVEQTGQASYHRSAPSVQFHDVAVSPTTQDVSLSPLATYSSTLHPKITVSMWEDQETPTVASAPYKMTCELVVDGKVVGFTSYVVAAGQVPALVASSQTEVMP